MGKRFDSRYIVEGDIAAIWPEIVATVGNEDPSIVIVHLSTKQIGGAKKNPAGTMMERDIVFGVEIPICEIQTLKNRVMGTVFQECGKRSIDINQECVKRLRLSNNLLFEDSS